VRSCRLAAQQGDGGSANFALCDFPIFRRCMMARWILLGMTILGTIVVFTTHNAALLAIAMLIALVGFIGFIGSLAASRIAASSRPELAMASREDMMAMRKPPVRPTPAAPPARAVAAPIDPPQGR